VAEWPNASVLKTEGGVIRPGVRIPPLPIFSLTQLCTFFAPTLAREANCSAVNFEVRGVFYAFREIHLSAESFSPSVVAKNVQNRVKKPVRKLRMSLPNVIQKLHLG
jgi:hypothetical protein